MHHTLPDYALTPNHKKNYKNGRIAILEYCSKLTISTAQLISLSIFQ